MKPRVAGRDLFLLDGKFDRGCQRLLVYVDARCGPVVPEPVRLVTNGATSVKRERTAAE